MSTQHTPEPWPEFYTVATKSKICDMDVVELGIENYNRAKLCVDACAGVPLEVLEAMPSAPASLLPMYARLEQQRDELLAYTRHRPPCNAGILREHHACICGLSAIIVKARGNV